MTRETIVERVAKLLSLADERGGGTEAERNLAAERAQALMLKHRIEQEELAEIQGAGREVLPGIEGEWFLKTTIRDHWKGNLLAAIGKPVGVDSVYYSRGMRREWKIVGRPDQLAYTKQVFAWVAEQLELAASASVIEHKAEHPELFDKEYWNPGVTAGRSAAHRRSFLDAAVSRIGARLSNAAAEEPGTDLVVSDQAAKDEYYGVLKPKSVVRHNKIGSGSGAGAAAGASADLSPSGRVKGAAPKELGA